MAKERERSPWALLVVLPVAIAWIGVPTAIFGGLWLVAFTVAENVLGIEVPAMTLGVVPALGGPPTVNGVPTVLVVGAGLLSTAAWFALFGGGDSPGKFRSTDRDERRFEL